MIDRLKDLFCDAELGRAWFLSAVSVGGTIASWLNIINASLTTCVLVVTLYLTARKLWRNNGKSD